MEAEGGIEPPSTALQAAALLDLSTTYVFCLRFITLFLVIYTAQNETQKPAKLHLRRG
jgi:hypothetical protein